MRTIRASEIGTYVFCARAWWYRINGVPSENNEGMAAGSAFHNQHGGRVLIAQIQSAAGWFLLMVAFILLVVLLTSRLVN
jgi:CRISPR/Cas system-associated exonuclease Cas4 (RecB family)